MDTTFATLPIGKGEVVQRGSDVLMVCFGPIIQNALKAAEILARDHKVTSTVINARFAKPLDGELLRLELPHYSVACTVEDHALQGGFGSAVLELINEEQIQLRNPLVRFGVQDDFVPHGSQAEQHKMNGYDPEGIVAKLLTLAERKLRVA
jgi:1-deoxy-D-xylulose-5-phosphate synthase